MIVIKRDGREVAFDYKKIYDAIIKAYEEVRGYYDEYAENIANMIALKISNESNNSIGVEDIQDKVEELLMSNDPDVARAYIIYRNDRSRIRNHKTDLMRLVDKKIKATDVENQNANVDEYSFGGRKGEAANALLKQHALDNVMSEMAKNNHLNNEIYIHDLDSYSIGQHNCLTLPLSKLLSTGFNTRQTDVRPANSINTAFQLVAVLFQLQSLQQFGGVSAGSLDHTMVPYVRKSFAKHFIDGVKYFSDNKVSYDNEELSEISIDSRLYNEQPKAYVYSMEMTERELKQAVEGLYHNLNTLQSRSGN